MSRGDAYFARLKATLNGVVENLRAKGIDERHLAFGGEGQPPARKPTVPTDARSEFLANRAMGDLESSEIDHGCFRIDSRFEVMVVWAWQRSGRPPEVRHFS